MFYMKNKLGAWQVGNSPTQGKVSFAVFFPLDANPNIKKIQVAGDFQNQLDPAINDWEFDKGFELTESIIPEGTIWKFQSENELQSGFYQYKYLITFNDDSKRYISDPCTRYSGSTNQNAAFVIGGSQPTDNIIAPLKNGRKPVSELIIYEIQIYDFVADFNHGKEAPLQAIIHKLDYIKDIGFNAILFMPWTGWKSQGYNWGYEPIHYFSVAFQYANAIDKPAEKLSWLKLLINECHKRDIHVIMDGVYNHTSKDFPYKQMYLNQEDCPYTGIYEGSFSGLEDLNFNNECTNEFIRDVCLYWIEEFKIDGIRFDNTVNFYKAGDTKGLNKILDEIDSFLNNKNELNFSLTIEHIQKDACTAVNNTKANSYWDNALYEVTFNSLWEGTISTKLLNALNNRQYLIDENKVPSLYLSNHDHSQVAFRAGARKNRGSMQWNKTQPYVIALFTSTAIPLVQAGAEFAEEYFIPENDEDTGRRVISRPLRWKLCDDKIGVKIKKLYHRMAKIRRDYAGLCSNNFYPNQWQEWQTQFNTEGYGIDLNKQIAIYHRWGISENTLQKFIIVLNFSDISHEVCVPFPSNGTWTDLLSNYDGSWRSHVYDNKLCFEIGPNWGHVFFQ